MKKTTHLVEDRQLQLPWMEQFALESERAIEEEDNLTIARTVLFYAGLKLERHNPSACRMQAFSSEAPAIPSWLFASEEAIVEASLARETPANGRLLQLSLYAISCGEASILSDEEQAELRTYAARYLCSLEKLCEDHFC